MEGGRDGGSSAMTHGLAERNGQVASRRARAAGGNRALPDQVASARKAGFRGARRVDPSTQVPGLSVVCVWIGMPRSLRMIFSITRRVAIPPMAWGFWKIPDTGPEEAALTLMSCN